MGERTVSELEFMSTLYDDGRRVFLHGEGMIIVALRISTCLAKYVARLTLSHSLSLSPPSHLSRLFLISVALFMFCSQPLSPPLLPRATGLILRELEYTGLFFSCLSIRPSCVDRVGNVIKRGRTKRATIFFCQADLLEPCAVFEVITGDIT